MSCLQFCKTTEYQPHVQHVISTEQARIYHKFRLRVKVKGYTAYLYHLVGMSDGIRIISTDHGSRTTVRREFRSPIFNPADKTDTDIDTEREE